MLLLYIFLQASLEDTPVQNYDLSTLIKIREGFRGQNPEKSLVFSQTRVSEGS